MIHYLKTILKNLISMLLRIHFQMARLHFLQLIICLDQNIRLWDIDINGSEKIYFNIAHINTFN